MFYIYSNSTAPKINEKVEHNMKTKSSPECKGTNTVDNNAGPPTRRKWVNEHLIKVLAPLSAIWEN